jgi:hypothetical protein
VCTANEPLLGWRPLVGLEIDVIYPGPDAVNEQQPMCASSDGNRTGRSETRRDLSRGLPALLDEHVLQPDAQRVQLLPEPVSQNVGLIEFVACLLTGRE